MYRDECGKLKPGCFHVHFGKKVHPSIEVDTVEPWLKARCDGDAIVYGQLNDLGAKYDRGTTDCIRVHFCCVPWFGEAYLDRDQAGSLLLQLVKAINDYDAQASQRARNPEIHHLEPDAHESLLYQGNASEQRPELN